MAGTGQTIYAPRLLFAGLNIRAGIVFLLAIASFLTSGTLFAQESIGNISDSSGVATIVRGDKPIPAQKGTLLYASDLLRTGENSRVAMTLSDGSRILLGPSSQLAMDRYAFNDKSREGSMMLNFARGSMRMISGAIAKTSPGQANIKTPTATCGIRGTDFIIEIP